MPTHVTLMYNLYVKLNHIGTLDLYLNAYKKGLSMMMLVIKFDEILMDSIRYRFHNYILKLWISIIEIESNMLMALITFDSDILIVD